MSAPSSEVMRPSEVMRRGRFTWLGIVVVVLSLVAAGWLNRWTERDTSQVVVRVKVGDVARMGQSSQTLRVIDMQVGQALVSSNDTSVTASRFLVLRLELTTPDDRRHRTMACNATQDGKPYSRSWLSAPIFPEPGLRSTMAIAIEFDPATAAGLRIMCSEASTVYFRTTHVEIDPGFGTEQGRRTLAASEHGLITRPTDTEEIIR